MRQLYLRGLHGRLEIVASASVAAAMIGASLVIVRLHPKRQVQDGEAAL